MKIAVLIKQVPDTETKIRIKPDGTGIEEGDIKYVVSPYDEFAIEEAIKLRERAGVGETVVISLGPDRAVEAMRTALAMGIEKGIHLSTGGETFDSFMTAKAFSKVIRDRSFDLILCGKQAIDADNAQVPAMIASLLDLPQVMIVDKIDLKEDKKGAMVTRRVAGGTKEIYDVTFPAVIGCDKGLNTPRYASLPGIMKAKSKPVEKLQAKDFLEGATPLVTLKNFQPPPERMAGKKIEGDPAVQARELARLLREEAKVI